MSKFLFTSTITVPTFFSLALIGIVKDSETYFSVWKKLFQNCDIPNTFDWWVINISILFVTLCLIILCRYLKGKSEKTKESKTIEVISYSYMSQNGVEQIVSSIIPWLTIFSDQIDFVILFTCLILQCGFITLASYKNNSYNLLCAFLGYRYYEVKTNENTYILMSKKCIKNKCEINQYVEITDYVGLII